MAGDAPSIATARPRMAAASPQLASILGKSRHENGQYQNQYSGAWTGCRRLLLACMYDRLIERRSGADDARPAGRAVSQFATAWCTVRRTDSDWVGHHMTDTTKVLLISPRFAGRTFLSLEAVCEVYGGRAMTAPLGLITVAAMLPPSWDCRLVNRNTEDLTDADIDWADLVMIGGMMPQRADILELIDVVHARGKPVAVGGPDVTSSPEAYETADFRVLGEAEGIIDDFISAWEAGERCGRFEAEKFTADVTTTPVPRFDLLKRQQYTFYGVQFSRGCPFTCEFCDIIELYGRVPRFKTAEQMLTELDTLYRMGYRGQLDFVDDNFIGNKKAVKAFLPHLIEWQKAHGYPFNLSTEASINLADDDVLLSLMREANFCIVFVGIESPETDTLVSMQKKQNTRRVMADNIHKLYGAGILVVAGFILGFDTEQDGVAGSMIDCIEATSIPVCQLGLLIALPGTQLTRRLARERRLYSVAYLQRRVAEAGVGDQCVSGLNFETKRPRRDILVDYRHVLDRVYSPDAFFGRVRNVATMLRRPALDRSNDKDPPPKTIFGVPRRDLVMLWRIVGRLAVRQPDAVWPFLKLFRWCIANFPSALPAVGMFTAFYLHVGPFSRFVIKAIDRQIAEIDSGQWEAPIADARELTRAGILAPGATVDSETAEPARV
jgi:radical SAM superfamily enzyme YgiQ (UPF0313 family)